MSLPIRAFLMSRVGEDNWRVEVCRDFEAILSAWEKRSDLHSSAILHLGFDRPNCAAFEEVASAHPGRMLFTTSAKHGLPAQFTSSNHPVGRVEDLSLHLALRGWGYDEDEPICSPSTFEPSPASAAAKEWTDWLVGFSDARPEFSDEMLAAGVTSEAGYLRNEANLSWEARYRSGLHRFGLLIAGDEGDPCAIVRAAPPWVRERKLEELNLTVRLRNIFVRAKFTLVEDIGQGTLAEMFRMPNFGRKCIEDLRGILLELMTRGPLEGIGESGEGSSPGSVAASSGSLLSALHRSLALSDQRSQDILVRRMGFGRGAETLQEIADDYGVTRERIRQIEAKETKRIILQEHWDDVLAEKMERLLANRDYPLPVLGLEAVDDWFMGVASEPRAFGYLLANFCGGRVSITEISGVQYIGFLTEEEWQAALSEATRIMRYAGDKSWSERHILSLLAPVLPEKAREFRSLLWAELSRQCHFSANHGEDRILVSFGRGIEPAIEALLADSDAPLHYTEIAARLEQRLSKPVDVRRAHVAAANVGILLGRGIFGAEKHLNVESGLLEKIADEACAIIVNGSSAKQWHAAELLSGLVERGFAGEYLDKYVVDYAMRKCSSMKRLGRMAWSVFDQDSVGERIDIREAVESLIVDAGRPLTTPEIRQRLVALRGVNDTFQFSFVDPVIRIAPGTWGLNDRDVPVPRSEQSALIEGVINKLLSSNCGIHISEIGDALDRRWATIPPQIVFSIATLDDRVKVSVGQFLYLGAWGGPRRETVFQIVQRLVDAAKRNFTTSEIMTAVAQESTLPIDSSQISACIRSAGATYDAGERDWSVEEPCDDPTPD